MQLDGTRAYAEMMDAGNDWADKSAAADLYDEQKHSVLSELMLNSDATSNAARETEARASQRYQQFVRELVEARRVANRARVRLDAVKVLAELRRTESANRRAEQQFVQGGSAGT